MGRALLLAFIACACGDGGGRYLHLTVTHLPEQSLVLVVTVDLGERAATQRIDADPSEGVTDLAIELPEEAGPLAVTVEVEIDTCVVYRGAAEVDAGDEAVVPVTVEVAALAGPLECDECGALGEACCGEAAACDEGLACTGGWCSCVADVAVAWHGCSAGAEAELRCWGYNATGQIGYDAPSCPGAARSSAGADAQCSPNPTVVTAGALEVSTSDTHTCAVDGDDTLWCFGDPFDFMPSLVSDARAYAQVGSGHLFSCALSSGEVWCVGENDPHILGVTEDVEPASSLPLRVGGVSDVVQLAVGARHACALDDEGAVACWGANERHQLGVATAGQTCGNDLQGFYDCTATPQVVDGLPDGVVAVAAGARHTCVLAAGDQVLCWGDGAAGQLGDRLDVDGSTEEPMNVPGTPPAIMEVIAGGDSTCVRTADRRATCWGSNASGQLAFGTKDGGPMPGETLYEDVLALSVSDLASCAITTAGVYCAGGNQYGTLGTGAFEGSSEPVGAIGLECE